MTAERPVLTHDEAVDLAPLFVIGALGRAEEIAVREHLETCPEPHPEFAELGSVVPLLLEDVELVEPPNGLKARILAAAAADLEAHGEAVAAPEPATRSTAVPPVAPAPPTRLPEAGERARRDAARPQRTWLTRANDWAFRAAAVIALVALGVWNVLLQRDLSAEQGYRTAVTQVIEVAGQPGSSLAVIHGDGEGTARGLAAVDDSGQVVFAMRDLPPTQGQEVYTAWAIAGGDPVNIGEFTASADGTGSLTTPPAVAAPGATLALTREPGRGATAPTLPIVASGVVTPAG
jgi:hypothetical protein